MSAANSNTLTVADLAREMADVVWRRVVPPVWWHAIQDYVIADGEIGFFRGHMVAGSVAGIRMVRNAVIVGQADWPNARYSDELSHLSQAAPGAGAALELWVLYDAPSDFPGRFVARKWLLDQPTSEVLQDQTLEGLRAKLPAGLTCLQRHPSDDPKIVETWL